MNIDNENVATKILKGKAFDIKREDGLTDEEGEVMDLLVKAWNKYSKLPKQHPDEPGDFADGIHICQDLLPIRIARRLYPKGWPIKPSEAK